jgi:peptidoglycan hydrolase-like protein with peptidoglycan-binding domain
LRNRVLSSICFVCVLASPLSAAASSKSVQEPAKKVSSKKQSHSSKSKRASAKSKARKGAWKRKGQQQIADDRTREIQAALIKANYLNGSPTGSMDARTKAALTRYQQDNGWQTKVVPDSRALIKLGLGPDRSNLLNPTTAALPNIKPADGSSSGSQE